MNLSSKAESLFNQFLGLIEGKKIFYRELSWVAFTEKFFFKIPRISDYLKSDMKNPEAQKFAREEYDNLVFLNRLDDALVQPVEFLDEYSCLVMKRVKGWDLFNELSNNSDPKALQLALEEEISVCARLHRFAPNGSENIPYHDYSKNRFFPVKDEEIRALKPHAFTVVS